jgi:hypothetical protein
MSNEFDEVLEKWQFAAIELKRWKALESALRSKVVALGFEVHTAEGTETLALGGGYSLKASFKQTYAVDSDLAGEVLEDLENSGLEGSYVAQRLFSWTPKLSVSEYKALKSQHLAIVNSAVTVKAALPTLEIVAPKVAK